jgi:hypothetical protein
MENTIITSENENPVVETTQEEVKTYTQDEVLALLQSETDRKVSQALKTFEKNYQKKYEKQLSLSKLDGDEREKAEKDNRIAELEEQLAKYEIERNKSEIKSVLSSRGLSAEFADILAITDDVEANQALIEKCDKLVKAMVNALVKERIAGTAPKGNGGTSQEITKETAKKMSMAELDKLSRENPELFNKIFN